MRIRHIHHHDAPYWQINMVIVMIRWCTNRLNLTIYPQIVSCYHWISHQVMWAVLRRQPVWSDEMDLSTDHMDTSLWQPQSNRNKTQWLIQNRSVVHCRNACESFHLRPQVNETDQFREHSNLFITLHVPNERDFIGNGCHYFFHLECNDTL